MNTKEQLHAAMRKLGPLVNTVIILRKHPDFQDISTSTLYRWTRAKKHKSLVKARMQRAVEVLTGIVSKKKSSNLAQSVLKEIRELEQQLRQKIRLLEKLV